MHGSECAKAIILAHPLTFSRKTISQPIIWLWLTVTHPPPQSGVPAGQVVMKVHGIDWPAMPRSWCPPGASTRALIWCGRGRFLTYNPLAEALLSPKKLYSPFFIAIPKIPARFFLWIFGSFMVWLWCGLVWLGGAIGRFAQWPCCWALA